MKPPRRRWFIVTTLAAVALAAACSDSATGLEGMCLAAVNVDGVIFVESAADPPDPTSASSAPYLTVTRNTGCLDQGEPSDPLMHAESNFLEPGTTLHTIDGFDPTERLAVYYELIDEWLPLAPLLTTQESFAP